MNELSYNAEVLVAHKTPCTPDWRWENLPQAANDGVLNLWCVTEGVGTLTTRTHTYQLHAGDCFMLRMWDYSLGEHDPAHPLTVLWAIFRYRDLPGRPAETALPCHYRRLANLSFFSQLFERAINTFNAEGAARAHADPWMRAVLVALEEEDQLPQVTDVEQYATIRQICARLQAAPGQAVRIAALAEECHCTPGHFTRIFRRCTGLTPREFIVQTRIDAAKSLLYLSNYSISRIAEVLGYRDVFYFSRQFHEQTGLAPSAFRRR